VSKKTVAIAGAGRVGSVVGHLLNRAGYPITAVVARTAETAAGAAEFIGAGAPATDLRKAAGADIIFITTPDGVINKVCSGIAAEQLKPGAIVIHMSGAHSLDLLEPAKTAGAYRAVVHPLQSIAGREQGIKNLPGSYFRVEADPEARTIAQDIVRALGGVELVMPQWRQDKYSPALYHAGAVAVSNFFVALVGYGVRFYEALGADKHEALKAVLPLITGTLRNIEAHGIPGALTGPVMRGDVKTVRDHLEAMKRRAPELLGMYRELGKQTVALAREKGSITKQTAEELLKLLQG
jgi:predicted short-subunit dehydrogenase-like oxidoreductase (DUF2520 family)